MIVEILAGVLPGANFLDLEEGDGWGNLFIAFDPNILSDIMVFKEKVRKMVERVRNSRSKDGDKIRIPGENKIILRDKALEGGWVDVDEKILDDIKKFEAIGRVKKIAFPVITLEIPRGTVPVAAAEILQNFPINAVN